MAENQKPQKAINTETKSALGSIYRNKLTAAEAVFSIKYIVGLDFTVAIRRAIDLNLTILVPKMKQASSEGLITYSVPFDIAVNAVLTNTPEKYVKACFISTQQFDENINQIINEKGDYYNE